MLYGSGLRVLPNRRCSPDGLELPVGEDVGAPRPAELPPLRNSHTALEEAAMRFAAILMTFGLPYGGQRAQGFVPHPCRSGGLGTADFGRSFIACSSMSVGPFRRFGVGEKSKRPPGGLAASSAPSPAEFVKGFFAGLGLPLADGASNAAKRIALEAELLRAIEGVQGRGRDVTQEQRASVDAAVEALESDGGLADAANSRVVDGSWRLIFTTTPGTASPVQRSFVGVENFAIYQDIDLFSETNSPTVTNVVDFGPRIGQLRVTALASTPAKPMDGFVPRTGDGRFFGLNILGVSQTTPPKDPNARIDFQFDEAGFDFKPLPFNIPYPVPFRWLGDEVKGWIDVTYLSERLRVARGNKGTLFVLQRAQTP